MRYDCHENSPGDREYRDFLSRLSVPLMQRLKAPARGLDFGCGPGPTLSVMFEERGFAMEVYDLYYAPDETVWGRTYDFITASEVAEHLRDPRTVFRCLWAHLQPGGYLGIMTQLVPRNVDFATWPYQNDPTHICFFSEKTFRRLAESWNAEIEVLGTSVVLFRKRD